MLTAQPDLIAEVEVAARELLMAATVEVVAADEPFEQTLRWGARGVLVVERALQSSTERRWVDVPPPEHPRG